MAEVSYGQRFLDALKAHGVTSIPWKFKTVQRLKSADREGMICVLREDGWVLNYAASRAIRSLEPEELARKAALNVAASLPALSQFESSFNSFKEEPADTPPLEGDCYGERFVRTLRAGGGGYSPYSYEEIQTLKRADREEAIRVLGKSLGGLTYAAIQAIRSLEPEALAKRVLRRYGTSSGPNLHQAIMTISSRSAAAGEPELEEQAFGLRFLNAIQEGGGGFSSYDYATTQRLKTADREGMIRILREEGHLLTYASIQAIRAMEPERLAEKILTETEQAQQMTMAVVLVMIAAS